MVIPFLLVSTPPSFIVLKKWPLASVAALVAPVARTDEGPFAGMPEGVEAGMVVAAPTAGVTVDAVAGSVLTTKNMM